MCQDLQEERCKGFFNAQRDNKPEPFRYLGPCSTVPEEFCCDNVEFRILLIGEFEKPKDDGEFEVLSRCDKPSGKLEIIVSLLNGGGYTSFQSNSYWTENIGAYYVIKRLAINDYWKGKEFDKGKAQAVEKVMFDKDQKSPSEKVQIVQVADMESALVLLGCCKFDVVLLDKTDLFVLLRLGPEVDAGNPIVEDLIKNNKSALTLESLKEFLNAVRLNRGPLDKYWVLAMDEDFLQKMQVVDIRLTDHRWNIFIGPDPDSKPSVFLYRLNEIIDLQLRLSVFRIKTLLTFLIYTCEDIKDHVANKVVVYDRGKKMRKVNDDELFFEGFQDFMGAEYANLMKRYGARKLIERDAFKVGDKYNKSLFATFVNKSFYLQRPVEKELIRLMRSFYHQASSMFNDRNGRQRLRESFEALRNFISYNGLVTELVPETSKRFLDGMKFLRAVIDSDFYLIKMKKWL